MDKAVVISMVCAAKIEYLAVERDEWRTLWPMLAAWYQQHINHLVYVQANFEHKSLVLYDEMTPRLMGHNTPITARHLRQPVTPMSSTWYANSMLPPSKKRSISEAS